MPDHHPRSPRAIKLRATLCGALSVLLPTLCFLFLALLVDGLRCDDSCGGGGGWRQDPQAWQWSFHFLALALPAGACALATVVCLASGRPRGAARMLAATVAFVAGWALFPLLSGFDDAISVGRFLLGVTGLDSLAGGRDAWPALLFWVALLGGGGLTIRYERLALARARGAPLRTIS